MGRIVKYLMCVAFTFVAHACRTYDVDDVLLAYDDISLTVKGELQFKYSPLTCQVGYDSVMGEFRAYDDKLAHWFVIRCPVPPANEGETLKAYVEYTTQNTVIKYDDMEFVVKKISSDGYIWLWNDYRKIGAVIRSCR